MAACGGTQSLTLTNQSRAMQKRIKKSTLPGGLAGARDWGALRGVDRLGIEAGVGKERSGGADRDQFGGRSRFIPALLNGFWFVVEAPRSIRLVSSLGLSTWARARSVSGCATVTCCSGPGVASADRSAQHPVRAANRARAAMTATADRHGRDLPKPQRFTVIHTLSPTTAWRRAAKI